jgi:hypothetical protein
MIVGFAFDSLAANIGLVAAIVVGVGVIWQKGVVPVYRFIKDVVVALDTLADIAMQFRPNDGTSLWDRLTRIEDTVDKTAIIAWENQEQVRKLCAFVGDIHDEVTDDEVD